MVKDAICLFHIPFRVLNETQLVQLNSDELETPALYSVWCVSSEQCLYLSNTKDYILNHERITWVPVGSELAAVFPKYERHVIADFSIKTYLRLLGEYCEEIGAEACLVMDTERQSEAMLQIFRETFPYLALHTISMEYMASDEALVNEINSVAPEILVLGLPTDTMKRYMENNRHRTNSRLCICLGDTLLNEMIKKKKMFHTMTMRRHLKRELRKFIKKEQKNSDPDRHDSESKEMEKA